MPSIVTCSATATRPPSRPCQSPAEVSCMRRAPQLGIAPQGLPILRRRAILGHRGLHERLERARVDLLPFVDVDRPSRVAFLWVTMPPELRKQRPPTVDRIKRWIERGVLAPERGGKMGR